VIDALLSAAIAAVLLPLPLRWLADQQGWLTTFGSIKQPLGVVVVVHLVSTVLHNITYVIFVIN